MFCKTEKQWRLNSEIEKHKQLNLTKPTKWMYFLIDVEVL